MSVAETRYLPGCSRRSIHVVLPSERLQSLPLFSWAPLPVTITQLGSRVSDLLMLCLTTWSRLIDAKLDELISDMQALSFTCPVFAYLSGCISSLVTVPFPSSSPWHCVDLASAPVVAARDRCRAGGWHIVHEAARLGTCSSIFFVACCCIWFYFSIVHVSALCGASVLSGNYQCTIVANVPLGT